MRKHTVRAALLGSVLLLLSVILLGVPREGAAGEKDLSGEVARLSRETPSLEQYPSAKGLVLQRRGEYSLRADGALVKRERWIVQLTEAFPDAWRSWSYPVPPGGECRVLSAGLYSMPFGKLRTPLLPRNTEVQGVPAVRVDIPYLEENLIFVLEYEQVIPRRFDVGDFLWLQEDLPLWEQEILARVPRDAPLFWESPGVPEPEVEITPSSDIYRWRVINTPPRIREGLVEGLRPSLAFSLRKGLLAGLKELDDRYRKELFPKPLGIFARILEDNKPHRIGKRLLDEMNSSEWLLREMPASMVRPGSGLSGQGPWTPWERTLLAARWLQELGWKVTLWWLPQIPPGKDAPGTRALWREPVLECDAPGDVSFYYLPGQTVEYGKIPASLWGKTLYRAEGIKVEERRLPEGSLEDHRLTLSWNVSMDAAGDARGHLDLYVRGGWVDLFGEDAAADPLQALDMVEWSVPYRVTGEVEREGYSYGYRVRAPIEAKLGIPGTGQVLARVPGAELPWVTTAQSQAAPFRLRFPFVLEQKLFLRLPPGFRVVGSPKVPESSGEICLKGSFYHNKRRHYIEGERKAMVKPTRIDAARSGVFLNVLQGWERWKTIFVPLKEK